MISSPESPPQQGFGAKFREQLPGYMIAAILGFAASWVQSQYAQNDLRNKVERLEEKQVVASQIEAKRAAADVTNAAENARLAEALKNLVDRQQEMKEERQRR